MPPYRRQRKQQAAPFGAARVREAFPPRDGHRTLHQRRQVRQSVI